MRGPSIEEMKLAIGALFLGEGMEKMKEEQMLGAISIKRRWFDPKKAEIMIKNAKSMGLLENDGDYLRPSFDYKEMEVPFGYYPPEELAELYTIPPKDRLIRELSMSEEELKQALSMDYNLYDEVKIVLWAAMNGRKYSEFLDDLENWIINGFIV